MLPKTWYPCGRQGATGIMGTQHSGVHSGPLFVETAVCSDIVRGGAKGAL